MAGGSSPKKSRSSGQKENRKSTSPSLGGGFDFSRTLQRASLSENQLALEKGGGEGGAQEKKTSPAPPAANPPAPEGSPAASRKDQVMAHLGKLTSTLKCLSAKLEFAQLSQYTPGKTPNFALTPMTPAGGEDHRSPFTKMPDFSEILEETEKFGERMTRYRGSLQGSSPGPTPPPAAMTPPPSVEYVDMATSPVMFESPATRYVDSGTSTSPPGASSSPRAAIGSPVAGMANLSAVKKARTHSPSPLSVASPLLKSVLSAAGTPLGTPFAGVTTPSALGASAANTTPGGASLSAGEVEKVLEKVANSPTIRRLERLVSSPAILGVKYKPASEMTPEQTRAVEEIKEVLLTPEWKLLNQTLETAEQVTFFGLGGGGDRYAMDETASAATTPVYKRGGSSATTTPTCSVSVASTPVASTPLPEEGVETMGDLAQFDLDTFTLTPTKQPGESLELEPSMRLSAASMMTTPANIGERRAREALEAKRMSLASAIKPERTSDTGASDNLHSSNSSRASHTSKLRASRAHSSTYDRAHHPMPEEEDAVVHFISVRLQMTEEGTVGTHLQVHTELSAKLAYRMAREEGDFEALLPYLESGRGHNSDATVKLLAKLESHRQRLRHLSEEQAQAWLVEQTKSSAHMDADLMAKLEYARKRTDDAAMRRSGDLISRDWTQEVDADLNAKLESAKLRAEGPGASEVTVKLENFKAKALSQADADLTAKLEKQKAWVEGADIKELSTPAKGQMALQAEGSPDELTRKFEARKLRAEGGGGSEMKPPPSHAKSAATTDESELQAKLQRRRTLQASGVDLYARNVTPVKKARGGEGGDMDNELMARLQRMRTMADAGPKTPQHKTKLANKVDENASPVSAVKASATPGGGGGEGLKGPRRTLSDVANQLPASPVTSAN